MALNNRNTSAINYVKETIQSSTIWTKLMKTIQSANINMEKLIKDSVDYGLEIGIFKESNDGVVCCKEQKALNSEANDLNKIKDELQPSHISTRSVSKTESDVSICEENAVKSVVDSRKFKRSPLSPLPFVTKRFKKEPIIVNKDTLKNKIKFKKQMSKPITVCAYCLGDEYMNVRKKCEEDMISCWDCGTCAHPTCLQWPDNLLETVRNIRWQCLQCKCCSYCGKTSTKDEDMLLCDACDQGFHMLCCNPQIKTFPKGEWVCKICQPITGCPPQPIIFDNFDFDFQPNCQIIMRKLVNFNKCKNVKFSSTIKKIRINNKTRQLQTNKTASILQKRRKKLLAKAARRQKEALTDGLSCFFTPSNKRQSRVSKSSLSDNSMIAVSQNSDKPSIETIDDSTVKVEVSDSIVLRKEKQKTEKAYKKIDKDPAEVRVRRKYKPRAPRVIDQNKNRSVTKLIKSAKNRKLANIVQDDVIRRGPGRPPKNNAPPILEPSFEQETTIEDNEVAKVNKSKQEPKTLKSATFEIIDLDREWFTHIQKMLAEKLPPTYDGAPQLLNVNKGSTEDNASNGSEPPKLCKQSAVATVQQNLEDQSMSGDASINQRNPPKIQIGKYIIQTWYSAPYPSEYARLNILYICEYCLKHIKSYDVYKIHMEKCNLHFPPGNEIYRNGELSIFEVDGYISKLYCQQLCLLAKLFLDHKTLYYDVEPFLFYVAVIARNNSTHIIGYFSKEKRSSHQYNLSCIMVLPPYQRYNYGRFLIDFSYLLSRHEGECGSPEKPLSVLGSLSYQSYWKSKVIPYLFSLDNVGDTFYQNAGELVKPSKAIDITIEKISRDTGINPHDITSTIQSLSKKVDLDDSDRITIQFDWVKIRTEAEKYVARCSSWISLNPDCLRWAPLVHPNEKIPVSQVVESPDSKRSSKVKSHRKKKSIKIVNIDEKKALEVEIVENKSSRNDNVTTKQTEQLPEKTTIIENKEKIPVPQVVESPDNKRPRKVVKSHRKKKSIKIVNIDEKKALEMEIVENKTSKDDNVTPKQAETDRLSENMTPIENNVKSSLVKKIHRAKIPSKLRFQRSVKKIIEPIEVNVDDDCELIMTRNRKSQIQKVASPIEENLKEVPMIDLVTESDSSQPATATDDCIEVSFVMPTRSRSAAAASSLKSGQPVLERLTESLLLPECPALSSSSVGGRTRQRQQTVSPRSQSSPRNDCSPPGVGPGPVEGSLLVSPHLDDEDDSTTVAELPLREPVLILEKCDTVEQLLVIDLVSSDEGAALTPLMNPVVVMRDIASTTEKDSDSVLSHTGTHTSTLIPPSVAAPSSSPPSLDSGNGCHSDSSNTEPFCMPPPPPQHHHYKSRTTLLRQESGNSSSSSGTTTGASIRLPRDYSQDDEFRSFFNNGHVFNSITTASSDGPTVASTSSSSSSLGDSPGDTVDSVPSLTPDDDEVSAHTGYVQAAVSATSAACSPGQSDHIVCLVSSTTEPEPQTASAVTTDPSAPTTDDFAC